MKKHPFTVVDLFAGCGGLSLGLEQAGFQPIFVNELNDIARATYLLNRLERFPHLSGFQSGDIREMLSDAYMENLKERFSARGINDIDLVCGGPPCQGFSRIGHRRSYSVEKQEIPSNRLYQDMAWIVRRLNPRIFLFENVSGVKSARWTKEGSPGEIWEAIFREFEGLSDYDVAPALVKSSAYGVPQNRPRVLIVGIRKNLGLEMMNDPCLVAGGFLPQPAGVAPDLEDLLSDLRDPRYIPGETRATLVYPTDPLNDIQREFRLLPSGAIASKGFPIAEHEYSRHSTAVTEKFRTMQLNGGKVPELHKTRKFSQRVLPPRWTRGPSITVTSLPDDYVHWHPGHPRTLTVREWARLQTFPDWYRFCGPRTTGGLRRAGNPREGLHERELPKYTQIGNAVPVKLARAIGEHFAKLLSSASN